MPNPPAKPKPSRLGYDPVARLKRTKAATEERRTEARYPFTTEAEIVDLRTGTRMQTRTADLSLGGCYMDTMSPLAVGAVVQVKLVRDKKAFEARARVTTSHPGVGMGLCFTEVLRQDQQALLEFWIAQLSERSPGEFEVKPASAREHEAPRPRQPVLAKLIVRLVRKGCLTEAEGWELLRELQR